MVISIRNYDYQGAFCLPILQIVWETLKDLADGKGTKGAVSAAVPSWTMSFFDRGNALAVTPDGLRCQSREFKEWHGCRSTTGVKGGLQLKTFIQRDIVNVPHVFRHRKVLL